MIKKVTLCFILGQVMIYSMLFKDNLPLKLTDNI